MSSLLVDHLLIATPDLDLGSDYVERLLGATPEQGGSHPGEGSRNALLGLSDDVYIEVIAPDPDQDPELPLGKFLVNLNEPNLMWWAARSDDIADLDNRLCALEINSIGPEPGVRTQPDGSKVNWDLLIPRQSGLGAAFPFFIQWSDMRAHPSRSLTSIGSLIGLKIRHPDSRRIRSTLGEFVDVLEGESASISAEIKIGERIVRLESDNNPDLAIGDIGPQSHASTEGPE